MPLALFAAQLPIGGRDDAHVGAAHLGLAEPQILAALEEAQQRHLHVVRQLADLVEEQRAAMRGLDQADALGVRAGERALAVAEQLRQREVGAQRAAIDREKDVARTRRKPVNGARDQLLAGAGLLR